MPFCRGVYLCIDYCNYCSAAQNNLTIIALGHNGAHVLIILTSRMTLDIRFAVHCPVELETKAIRRFAKVSRVSYSCPSLMIIASASQFHIYLPWSQRLLSIVS